MTVCAFKPSSSSSSSVLSPSDIISLSIEILGFRPSARLVSQLAYYARLMGLDTLEEAMMETSYATRPSIRYLIAILSRCEREGVRSLGDYTARNLRHQGIDPEMPFIPESQQRG